MAFTITITRGSEWETSYDVWAKHGSIPLEEGDGLFVSNYIIRPDQVAISNTATIYDSTYGFLVVPIIRRQGGTPAGYKS